MTRQTINPSGAVAVGPYSAAVEFNGLVFCSGQTPMDPNTKKLIDSGIEDQTRQCFANLGAVLEAARLGFEDVLQCKVYLTNMDDFAEMNGAYAEHFSEPFPSRTTIGVASLPMGASVEIELIAQRSPE